jgi:hypothetical protein
MDRLAQLICLPCHVKNSARAEDSEAAKSDAQRALRLCHRIPSGSTIGGAISRSLGDPGNRTWHTLPASPGAEFNMAEKLKTDYLIIGAGAMGMAFADTLLTETDGVTVTLVDRHDRPGGHWNDAYPFVRLHQPSAFYGVNSRQLGSGTIDQAGWNRGLAELASGSEVVTYFDQVMQQQFLPTGRVTYLPMCEWSEGNHVRSLVGERDYEIRADKLVDATYMDVQVPATRGPLYTVDDGVTCMALNELPRVADRAKAFVIVGAGKTGMDACLWLLRNHVDPDRIRWIMPRDSWLLDRQHIQPGNLAAGRAVGSTPPQQEPPKNVEEVFRQAEQTGGLLRIDPNVRPTMYRCATVTQMELEQLRRITQVVRMGHVTRIAPDRIHLDEGTIPSSLDTIHVDCTADALSTRPAVPVFQNDRITLQTVRTCQQVFSAAFIGYIETNYDDQDRKNALTGPVPHPDTDLDWLRTSIQSARNQLAWAAEPGIMEWLGQSRLDGFTQPADPDAETPPPEKVEQLLKGQRDWMAFQTSLLTAAGAAAP